MVSPQGLPAWWLLTAQPPLGDSPRAAELRLVEGRGAVPVSAVAVKILCGEGGSGYSSGMAWGHRSCKGAGQPWESSAVQSGEPQNAAEGDESSRKPPLSEHGVCGRQRVSMLYCRAGRCLR